MKPITDEQLEILAREIDEIKNAEIVELSQRLQQAQVIINEAGTAVFAAWMEVASLYKENARLREIANAAHFGKDEVNNDTLPDLQN